MTTTKDTTTPTTGRAPVNGLDMYYEIHGTGRPLLLMHGGLLTIDLTFSALLPALAETHKVIAVELQGHGHTADIDREVTLEFMADDIVALLDHLGIERADLFGFSLGGLVALQTAISHPDRVDQLVLAATHYRPDGYYPEIANPALQTASSRLPSEGDFQVMRDAYTSVAPDPDHFPEFTAKVSEAVGGFQGWSADDLRKITSPTLIMIGDTDFVRLEHAVEMYELIRDSQLAIVPGTNHMSLMARAELVLPIVESFLARSS